MTEPTVERSLLLAYLERFIDFGSGPRYITHNGIRQDMPKRLRPDALALRAALVEVGSEPSPEPHKPGEFHRYRAECEVCGQPGQVRVTLVPEQAEEPS